MYHIIENWKITWSSENYLSSENWTTIQKDFTQEELKKIEAWYSYNIETWEFEETSESIEFEKQTLIQEYKELEKQATELRAKFLTYELDESPLTQAMKQKLEEKWEIIKTQIKEKAWELVNKYWVDILDELV